MDKSRVIFWNRVRNVFSWLALIIVLLGLVVGTMAMWQLMYVGKYVNEMKKLVKEYQVPPPVPTEAKETAKLFVGVWLSSVDATNPDKKIDALKGFISDDFEQFLSSNPNYLVQDPEQKFRVFRADPYGERWIVPNKEARIRVRVLTYDNRVFYFECPVRHSGNAWVVYQLPSLVSGPQRGNDGITPSLAMSQEEKDALKTTLENFMEVWLRGDKEAVLRYTEGKSIPVSNILQGTYQGVKEVDPLTKTDDVYKVRVLVGVQDQSNVNFTFSYDVKLHKKGDQWFILSVN